MLPFGAVSTTCRNNRSAASTRPSRQYVSPSQKRASSTRSFSSPLLAACSSVFAASSYSPLAMRARPHSSAEEATPKNAPTHASGPGSASAAVGFAPHGAHTVAGGNDGRSAGASGSGRSPRPTAGLSSGTSANGMSAVRSGAGGTRGSRLAARAGGAASSTPRTIAATARRLTTAVRPSRGSPVSARAGSSRPGRGRAPSRAASRPGYDSYAVRAPRKSLSCSRASPRPASAR